MKLIKNLLIIYFLCIFAPLQFARFIDVADGAGVEGDSAVVITEGVVLDEAVQDGKAIIALPTASDTMPIASNVNPNKYFRPLSQEVKDNLLQGVKITAKYIIPTVSFCVIIGCVIGHFVTKPIVNGMNKLGGDLNKLEGLKEIDVQVKGLSWLNWFGAKK